ncbi:MAG: type II secretion system protein [Lentisphaeria bacterium]|nr:type II secretion system protein [Lentisphaeria bacterium]
MIQLLVVIAIIAILAGMLLPALNKARSKGQGASCLNGLKQTGYAAEMYAADNQDNCPAASTLAYKKTNCPWYQMIEGGYLGKDAAACPSDMQYRQFYDYDNWGGSGQWKNYGKITFSWEQSAGLWNDAMNELYKPANKSRLKKASLAGIVLCVGDKGGTKRWGNKQTLANGMGVYSFQTALEYDGFSNHNNEIQAAFADGSARNVGKMLVGAKNAANLEYLKNKIITTDSAF